MNRLPLQWKAPLFLVLCSLVALVAGCAEKTSRQQDLASTVQPGKVTQAICTSSQLSISSATASSTENSGFPASEAIDGTTGDSSNRWSSAAAGTNVVQWLYVDLGANRYIDKVELDFVTTNAWSKDFTLSVAPPGTTDFSVNSSSWSTIYTRTGVTASDSRNHVITTSSSPALTATTGRYLRFKSTLHNIANVSFYEIRVFGSTDAMCNVACTPTCGACSTCTSGVCVPLSSGTVCRASAGVCDVSETCDGVATECPANTVASSGTECRAAVAGGCDVAETCDGAATSCPTDAVASNGTVCRTLVAGGCDLAAETCNGSSNACPADTLAAACTPCGSSALTRNSATASSSISGNAAGNAIDGTPGNTGSSRWESTQGQDPQWIYVDLGAERHISSVKINWETASAKNYTIQVAPNGTCSGSGSGCLGTSTPWTTIYTSPTITTTNRTDDVTLSGVGRYVRMHGTTRTTTWGYSIEDFAIYGDTNAVCGTSCSPICDACAQCVNSVCVAKTAGTVCRAAIAGGCDAAETCNGSATSCPADLAASSGTVCRAAVAGGCDLQEACTGFSTTCPSDAFASAGTVCRSSSGVCDATETCTGTANMCPANGFVPSGTTCRSASAGGCDAAEACSGIAATCPADAKQPNGTVCRSPAASCDATETCSGSSDTCPVDSVKPSGAICRGLAGNCDIIEACNGASIACPADVVRASGTVCRVAVAGGCDVAETCTGTGGACPADSFATSGTVCRQATGNSCDTAETCSGTSSACPADTTCEVGGPGQPGGECGGYVERLTNGDVQFAITFAAAQQDVQVFARKNGSQNIAHSMLGVSNGDGTYTYRYVVPSSTYQSGDQISARFYSYVDGEPGVFTPGPTSSTWLNAVAYSNVAVCSITGAPPGSQHPYIRMLNNGDLQFSVTLPAGQQYVEVFVRENGVQNVAHNIVSSGTSNGDGTTTYSLVKPANNFEEGDELITRFYSYMPSSPGVFTPGPEENIWSAPFIYRRLIHDIVISDTTPCLGEDFSVGVTTSDIAGEQVQIGDVVGSTRTLQFTGLPGTRRITVIATAPGEPTQVQTVEVQVQECAGRAPTPRVLIAPGISDGIVEFRITNAAELTGADRQFIWAFGDGETEVTAYPFVTHSYDQALPVDEEYPVFQGNVTVRRTGHADVAAQKTVSIWNHYGAMRRRGVIQPLVRNPRMVTAPFINTFLFDVINPEATVVSFDSVEIERHPCDATLEPTRLAPIAVEINASANATTTSSVVLPSSVVGASTCDVTLHLTGPTMTGRQVATAVHVEVRRNPLRQVSVTDTASLALLNQIAASGMVADPDRISDDELHRLYSEGRIASLPATPSGPIVPLQIGVDPAIGRECVKDSAPLRPEVTCQATDEMQYLSGHILNALKGDLLLVAGCEQVGTLLRQVDPPQRYSHEGIMIENYFELSHSTLSITRLKDQEHNVDADGWNGDFLTFGWPGAVNATVQSAFNLDVRPDPEGFNRAIVGFSPRVTQCEGDLKPNPPLVVKPFPGTESEVRALLHEAADIARNTRSHYRFFGFSDAAIAFDEAFSSPEGLPATVSSTFIWSVLKRAGITLEGDELEEEDIDDGAEVDADTMDGLYFYTEGDRQAALAWLQDDAYNEIFDQAGWFGELLTGAAGTISYQITNCFAGDLCGRAALDPDDCRTDTCCSSMPPAFQCSAKNATLWQTPGVGRTVSPDNFLFWDSYPQGVYGYSERMAYRSGGYGRIFRWAPAEGTGGVQGQVLRDGTPVEGALVVIGGVEGRTDASGNFELFPVFAGNYEGTAQCGFDPQNPGTGGCLEGSSSFLEDTQSVTIVADETLEGVVFNLSSGSEFFRSVTFEGPVTLKDDENFASDPSPNFQPFLECLVDPFNPTDFVQWAECVGGEVVGNINLNCSLAVDEQGEYTGDVNVTLDFFLLEGTSCSTDDVEDHSQGSFVAPANTTLSGGSFSLLSTGFGGGDRFNGTFSITNAQQF